MIIYRKFIDARCETNLCDFVNKKKKKEKREPTTFKVRSVCSSTTTKSNNLPLFFVIRYITIPIIF